MVDYNSDSDDSYNSDDWDNHGEAESSSVAALRSPVPQGSNGRADSLVEEFVRMGFPEKMVLKGLEQLSNTLMLVVVHSVSFFQFVLFPSAKTSTLLAEGTDGNELLSLLLAYQHVGDDAPEATCSTSRCAAQSDSDIGNWDADEREPNSDMLHDEGFLQGMSEMGDKLKLLLSMGFTEDEADLAVSRCGLISDIDVLIDSITSSQMAEDGHSWDPRPRGMAESNRKRKRCERGGGPPYFYYEDAAIAPKETWDRISTFLDNIVPELVDSKYMSAVVRERCCVHNLLVENRSPLLPLAPKTIFGVFPNTKSFWPSWDKRTQLNSLQSCTPKPKLSEHIHRLLASCDDMPPPRVQKYVMEECRKWNLLWIGKNRVASLEPHEMECLLGFPRNYTRGPTTADRYKSLGDAVQVDTVAYHFSVLKDMFPTGVNVLSMYTGIGGGVVALDKLGIRIKTLVSVETSKVRSNIFRSWWEGTQSGILVQINDVQQLSHDRVIALTRQHGDFDLIIGSNAWNNPSGSGEYDRNHFSLFKEYVRILKAVRSV